MTSLLKWNLHRSVNLLLYLKALKRHRPSTKDSGLSLCSSSCHLVFKSPIILQQEQSVVTLSQNCAWSHTALRFTPAGVFTTYLSQHFLGAAAEIRKASLLDSVALRLSERSSLVASCSSGGSGSTALYWNERGSCCGEFSVPVA